MKRFLRITQEAAYGTFPGSPVSIYPRLNTPNAFRHMTTPGFWEIMSGSGFAVPALRGTQQASLRATLTTPLCATQAQFLLGWCGLRINSGQTSPWTTTEPAGDFTSCALDYAWTNFDGTLRTKRFTGCKVARWSVSASKDNPVCMLTIDVVGSTPQGNSYDSSVDPTLTAPADSVFPVDPYLFQQLKGGFTLGSSRTNFESFTISSENALTAYFDESRFANAIRIGGRRTTVDARFRLKASPDDRASYENSAALACSMVLTGYSKSVTFAFNAQNFLSSVQEDYPLDAEVYYDGTIANLLDTTATTDFTMSFT